MRCSVTRCAASACLALGLAVWSSILTGLALAAVGLAFAGCAALAAQVMPSPRGANGLAAAAVGIAYLVRGAGDALGTARDVTHVDPSWVALLSPIGWAQATRPFTSADPLPLLVPLALGVVTAGAAVALQARRDLGASLVAERPGRAEWRDAGATRLALRNQVATTLGWAVGAAVLGLLAGALAPLIADVVGANDDLAALIARLAPDLDVTTSDVFSVAVLGIAGTLATAAGVQALTRLRPDEAEGRAELLLATSLSRAGWFARHVAVAVGSAVAVALAGGIAAGLGFAATGGGAERIGTSLTAILVHLPAGLVFLALAALAFAVLPRLSVALGWGLLVAGLALGQLGGLLGLPKWLQDVSPPCSSSRGSHSGGATCRPDRAPAASRVSLARDPVVVPVESRAVAGLAAVDGRGAGGARRIAVLVVRGSAAPAGGRRGALGLLGGEGHRRPGAGQACARLRRLTHDDPAAARRPDHAGRGQGRLSRRRVHPDEVRHDELGDARHRRPDRDDGARRR